MKNLLYFFIILLFIITLCYFINRNVKLMETIDILNTKLEEKQLEIDQYITQIEEKDKRIEELEDEARIESRKETYLENN